MVDKTEPEKNETRRTVPPMPVREELPPRKRPSLMTVVMVLMAAFLGVMTIGVLTLGSLAGPVMIMGFLFVSALVVQYWIWGRAFEKMYRSEVPPESPQPPPPMRERL